MSEEALDRFLGWYTKHGKMLNILFSLLFIVGFVICFGRALTEKDPQQFLVFALVSCAALLILLGLGGQTIYRFYVLPRRHFAPAPEATAQFHHAHGTSEINEEIETLAVTLPSVAERCELIHPVLQEEQKAIPQDLSSRMQIAPLRNQGRLCNRTYSPRSIEVSSEQNIATEIPLSQIELPNREENVYSIHPFSSGCGKKSPDNDQSVHNRKVFKSGHSFAPCLRDNLSKECFANESVLEVNNEQNVTEPSKLKIHNDISETLAKPLEDERQQLTCHSAENIEISPFEQTTEMRNINNIHEIDSLIGGSHLDSKICVKVKTRQQMEVKTVNETHMDESVSVSITSSCQTTIRLDTGNEHFTMFVRRWLKTAQDNPDDITGTESMNCAKETRPTKSPIVLDQTTTNSQNINLQIESSGESRMSEVPVPSEEHPDVESTPVLVEILETKPSTHGINRDTKRSVADQRSSTYDTENRGRQWYLRRFLNDSIDNDSNSQIFYHEDNINTSHFITNEEHNLEFGAVNRYDTGLGRKQRLPTYEEATREEASTNLISAIRRVLKIPRDKPEKRRRPSG